MKRQIKSMKKQKCGFTLIEVVVAVAIVAILAILIGGVIAREKVAMPEAYQAWCKETGNPKALTYQEWRSLERLEEEKRNQNITVYHY